MHPAGQGPHCHYCSWVVSLRTGEKSSPHEARTASCLPSHLGSHSALWGPLSHTPKVSPGSQSKWQCSLVKLWEFNPDLPALLLYLP